jgi:hypothetical protein
MGLRGPTSTHSPTCTQPPAGQQFAVQEYLGVKRSIVVFGEDIQAGDESAVSSSTMYAIATKPRLACANTAQQTSAKGPGQQLPPPGPVPDRAAAIMSYMCCSTRNIRS